MYIVLHTDKYVSSGLSLLNFKLDIGARLYFNDDGYLIYVKD